MAATAPPPVPPGDQPAGDAPTTRWTTVGRVAIVVMLLGIAGMWIYVLTADPSVPGRLEDAGYPASAQRICTAAKAELDGLPKAFQTPEIPERVKVVDQGTAILAGMVDRLEGAAPASQPDRDRVLAWIADWRTYLQDRRNYTAELPRNPGLRFYVTQRPEDSKQITEAMDRFVQPPVNDMPACATPDDLG